MVFEVGTNVKEIALAIVALVSTIAGYKYGYNRGLREAKHELQSNIKSGGGGERPPTGIHNGKQ